MALLESCLCCSLLVASAVVGIYGVVAYVMAFTIELWWILEAEITLPAPAYLLCAGYFIIFVVSAMLLHGLTVKRTFFLLSWLFTIVVFSFPEGGLVLFMSLYYWKVKSLYGLTELTYWACRVVFNIAGIVCIQSLYSTWREEKMVMRRLQDLKMASAVPEPISNRPPNFSNGHIKNGSATVGYRNAGFINSTARLNMITASSAPVMGRLRRSASSLSQIAIQTPIFGGSLPNNNHASQMPALTPCNNLHYAFFGNTESVTTGSEFNASTFDGLLAASVGSPFYYQADMKLPQNILGSSINRTQSLVDLRETRDINDIWQREGVPYSSSLDYPYFSPVNVTQSLDRRILRRSEKLRKASSVGDLNFMKHNPRNAYLYQELFFGSPLHGMVHSPFNNHIQMSRTLTHSSDSKRSLAESDDMQKIRDVAL